jgi:hypothetical protein
MRLDRLLAITTPVLLAACESITYYRPADENYVQTGGNACARAVYLERRLRDGIGLTMTVDATSRGQTLWISFRVPENQTVRISSAAVRLTVGANAPIIIPIEEIKSGSRPLGVPLRRFEATATLRGTDRYSRLAPPYGPDDRFVAKLALPIAAVERFAIGLPTIDVNGSVIELEPIAFVLTTEFRPMCLQ